MIIPAQFPMYVFKGNEDTGVYEDTGDMVVAWMQSERYDGEPFIEAALTASGETVYTGGSDYTMRTSR